MPPVGHLAASSGGDLLRADPGLAAMLGYGSVEELAASCAERTPDLWEDPADWEVFASRVLSRGEVARYPASLRRQDGGVLPCAAWGRLARRPRKGGQVVEAVFRSEAESHQAFTILTQVLRLHRDMMDLNPDPIIIHRDWRILLANPAAEAFCNSPERGSLVGRTPESLFEARSAARVRRRIRAASRGCPLAGEFRVVLAGGEELWVRDFNEDITFHGRPATLTLLHDRTERHRAERDLARAEALYRTVAESAPEPIFIHADWVILYANPALARFVGVPSPLDLVGRSVLEFFHPDAAAVFHARLRQILASPGGSDAEYPLLLPDGTARFVLARSVLAQYRGRPAVLSVLHDLTGRAQLERSLAETEHLYRTVLEHLPEAVCLHDDGIILYGNPFLRRMLAPQEGSDLCGRHLAEFLHPDSLSIYARRRDAAAAGRGEVPEEYPIRYADGRVLHVAEKTVQVEVRGRKAFLAILRDVTDRVAAEQGRAEAEDLYRTIVETSPDPVFIHEPGRLLFANQALARFYRVDSVASLLRMRARDLVDEENAEQIEARVRTTFETGRPLDHVATARLRDGAVVHYHSVTVPIRYQGRRCLLTTLRDLTAVRAAEQARAEAEALYRIIVETSPDPLLIHESGRILYANLAAAAFVSQESPASMVGKTFFDLAEPQAHHVIRERLRTIGLCQGLTEAEYPLQLSGGGMRDVHARSVDVEYRGRRAQLTVLHDLTAHRRAEAERDLALARHEDLFQSAPLGIARARSNRTFIRVNRRMADIFGYSSPEAMEAEVKDIAAQFFADPKDYWRLHRLVERQGEVQDFECLGRRRDGTRFWTSHSIRTVSGPNGELQGFEAFVRDITERRQAMEEAEERDRRVRILSWELAMAGERERSVLARDLHDGPVQLLALATLMFDDLARRGTRPPEFFQALDLLREATDQLRTTLKDLSPPALLADTLAEILAALGREFGVRHGLDVQVACPDLPGLSQEGKAFLCRAVRELLVNAVKHGRAGRAEIRVVLDGRTLRLAVQDNGGGFDPARLNADDPRTLGLPGLRRLVRDLGGDMATDSTLGGGTRVVLFLPLDSLGVEQNPSG